jgi:uncharacterized protein YycO
MNTLHRRLGYLLLLAAALAFSGHIRAGDLQTGDIIFQDSQSSQSRAIKTATGSPYSHVGLVVVRNGKPYVAEAIQPVSLTPLDAWIARGRKADYVVKRLKDSELRQESKIKLLSETKKYLGKDYDWQFGWSDREIYCSEFVWKVYQRSLGIELCELKSLKDFDLTHPIVRKTLAQRYGKSIPLSEPVVAPSDIFQSAHLVTIAN